MTSLWFGKNKPEMSIFLEIFVETMNLLSYTGIKCTMKGETKFIKLHTHFSCVDTISRASMNGSSQFNAYFGCDWCEHPGEYYDGAICDIRILYVLLKNGLRLRL